MMTTVAADGLEPWGARASAGIASWWHHQMERFFHVTGPMWEESTGHQWIPLTKASEKDLWCFLWSVPEQTSEQTIETAVIWAAIKFIMISL